MLNVFCVNVPSFTPLLRNTSFVTVLFMIVHQRSWKTEGRLKTVCLQVFMNIWVFPNLNLWFSGLWSVLPSPPPEETQRKQKKQQEKEQGVEEPSALQRSKTFVNLLFRGVRRRDTRGRSKSPSGESRPEETEAESQCLTQALSLQPSKTELAMWCYC